MSGQVRPHFVLRLCAIGIIAFTLMIVGGVAPRSVGLANPLLAQNLFNIAQYWKAFLNAILFNIEQY